MKKLKIFRAIIIAAIVWYIIYVGYNLAAYALLWGTSANEFEIARIRLFAVVARHILNFPALILIVLSLNRFIKHGYFNTGSAKGIRWAGWLILAQAIINLTYTYFIVGVFNETFGMIILGWSTMLPLCAGIGLMVLADFILRGKYLKDENQLTI
ncbi:DUF2975 domain-containing protein [Flavobacterium sp. RHBU_3]|uniref:DUF2975 domain-containing protein n=1 Tax=Flavobacterium sp. RHBU_3 TaxID=3391184 RepID=UPI003984619C